MFLSLGGLPLTSVPIAADLETVNIYIVAEDSKTAHIYHLRRSCSSDIYFDYKYFF